MAATLAGGPGALLGHRSAGALWGIGEEGSEIAIVVPARRAPHRLGIRAHRRAEHLLGESRRRFGIPLTDPITTLVDFASSAREEELDAAVNAADRLDLVDPIRLRAALDAIPPRPGSGRLRSQLDRHALTLADSVLERKMLALIKSARLPLPRTQAWVNGFRVDFFWPRLGLVVETDGLRYHRTAAQQAGDLRREHTHAAAGLESLRFSAGQVANEANQVRHTLATVIHRLEGR